MRLFFYEIILLPDSMLVTFITNIGDSAVLSAMVLAGVIYLFLSGYRIGAIALALSLILSGGLISGFKLLFLGCAWFLPHQYNIHSPSGHVALSTAVLGTCLLLVIDRCHRLQRITLVISCALLITAIAISRVVLEAHSIPEILVGFAVGSLALVSVAMLLRYARYKAGQETASEFNVTVFAVMIIAVALILNGTHLPSEQFIQAVAYYLGHNVHTCMHPAAT